MALKCDLREEHEKDDDEVDAAQPRHIVTYQEGLAVARSIGALRYLGMLHPLCGTGCYGANVDLSQNAQQCAIEASTKLSLRRHE